MKRPTRTTTATSRSTSSAPTILREIALQSVHAHQVKADAQRMREGASKCAISRTPLLEARVQELVPGINEYGMHSNRVLLFGGAKPKRDAVLMRSNDYLQKRLT